MTLNRIEDQDKFIEFFQDMIYTYCIGIGPEPWVNEDSYQLVKLRVPGEVRKILTVLSKHFKKTKADLDLTELESALFNDLVQYGIKYLATTELSQEKYEKMAKIISDVSYNDNQRNT